MEGIEEQIESIIEMLKSGMDHTVIKDALLKKGIEEETASLLLKKADSYYLDDLLIGKPEAKPILSRSVLGVLMIFAGISITVLTYLGAIGGGGYYVIWYGPVLAGIGIFTSRNNSRIKAIRETFRSPYDKWRR